MVIVLKSSLTNADGVGRGAGAAVAELRAENQRYRACPLYRNLHVTTEELLDKLAEQR